MQSPIIGYCGYKVKYQLFLGEHHITLTQLESHLTLKLTNFLVYKGYRITTFGTGVSLVAGLLSGKKDQNARVPWSLQDVGENAKQ